MLSHNRLTVKTSLQFSNSIFFLGDQLFIRLILSCRGGGLPDLTHDICSGPRLAVPKSCGWWWLQDANLF